MLGGQTLPYFLAISQGVYHLRQDLQSGLCRCMAHHRRRKEHQSCFDRCDLERYYRLRTLQLLDPRVASAPSIGFPLPVCLAARSRRSFNVIF